MIRIIMRPYEIEAALAVRLRCVVRAIEPQPQLIDGIWYQGSHCGGAQAIVFDRIPNPIGKPGDEVYFEHTPFSGRLTFRITDVRAMRLQDLSDDDARMCGFEHGEGDYDAVWSLAPFSRAWDEYTKPGMKYDDDPWVFVTGLEVTT